MLESPSVVRMFKYAMFREDILLETTMNFDLTTSISIRNMATFFLARLDQLVIFIRSFSF
jgi:hypothetical protein